MNSTSASSVAFLNSLSNYWYIIVPTLTLLAIGMAGIRYIASSENESEKWVTAQKKISSAVAAAVAISIVLGAGMGVTAFNLITQNGVNSDLKNNSSSSMSVSGTQYGLGIKTKEETGASDVVGTVINTLTDQILHANGSTLPSAVDGLNVGEYNTRAKVIKDSGAYSREEFANSDYEGSYEDWVNDKIKIQIQKEVEYRKQNGLPIDGEYIQGYNAYGTDVTGKFVEGGGDGFGDGGNGGAR